MQQALDTGQFHVYVFEGGSRCFAPDTLVVTESGSKPISEVCVGERVYCLDKDGNRVLRTVTNIFRHPVDKPMVEVRLKSGKVIRCSADHKFLYNGEYVPIIEILNSTVLLARQHRRSSEIYKNDIASWQYTDAVQEVFDVEVETCHNYFISVGEQEFNVHNSGKTYGIIHFFLIYALSHPTVRTRVAICRKKGTWLSATVWNDFNDILISTGLLTYCHTNKTLKTIQLFGTSFEFVGLDDTQRLHGLTVDIFWINEAMEAIKNDFDQLEQRCSRFAILDYNPSAEQHWIYDSVCTRPDCYFDHSTMLMNPFVPENSRRKILSYEPTEENFANGTADERKWKIYGLGLRAKIEGLVFDHYDIVPCIPEGVDRRWYGIDFGFANDSTAIVEVGYFKPNLYIHEHCYKTGMMTSEIISTLQNLQAKRRLVIISESADPRLVKEIRNCGLPIVPVTKFAGSIEAGLDFMRDCKINITAESPNLKQELDNYTYAQDKYGNWLNIPVDDYNHCFSADTLITTDRGLVPISSVKVGDKVLTRSGYKRVTRRWDNGEREVITRQFDFDNGTATITATPEHKFYTSKQWKKYEELTEEDVLCALSDLTEKPTTVTQRASTPTIISPAMGEAKKSTDCTETSTSFTEGLSQMDTTFTILTEIRSIITSTISCLSRSLNTRCFTTASENIIGRIQKRLQNGSIQKKTGKAGGLSFLNAYSANLAFANAAGRNLLPQIPTRDFAPLSVTIDGNTRPQRILSSLFARNADARSSEISTRSPRRAPANAPFNLSSPSALRTIERKTERVYDIEVEDAHEFFANGILVHNCIDATRYVCLEMLIGKNSKPVNLDRVAAALHR